MVVASLFFTLGCSCGLIDDNRLTTQRDTLIAYGLLDECKVRAVSDSTYGDFGSQCFAFAELDGKRYKVLLSFSDRKQVLCGERLLVSGRLSLPGNTSFLDERGAVAKVSVKDGEPCDDDSLLARMVAIRHGLINRLSASCDVIGSLSESKLGTSSPFGLIDLGDLRTLVLALACGFRPDLVSSQVYADFKSAGLAHLVAVSGAHLALVSGMIASILGALGLSRRICHSVVALLLLVYVVMVGMPISCLRAVVMTLLSLFSFAAKRRSSSLSALGVVVVFFLASDPSCATSLSFQLSVASTLGISLFAPWLSWWCRRFAKMPDFVRDSFSLTLSATVPTLPFAVVSFCQVPLVAPFSNLVAGLVLGIVMPLCLACFVVSGSAPLLSLLVLVLFGLLSLLILAVKALLLLPLSCVPVSAEPLFAFALGAVFCSLWWLLWPAPSSRNAARLLVCAGFMSLLVFLPYVRPGLLEQDSLVMLDVGQGDAILLKSNGRRILIDTGRNDKLLLSGLASEGVSHLDAVVLTHCDDDHYGSLDALRGSVGVDRVFVSEGTLDLDNSKAKEIVSVTRTLTGRQPDELTTSDILSFGHFVISVLSPERARDGGNQDSLVFSVSVTERQQSWRILMAGDAESETLESLVSEGRIGDIDVLKVSHHGSRASVSDSLLEDIKPELSLISVGENNSYGHPTEEALAALGRCGSEVFRTDEKGKVTCVFEPDGIKVLSVR